MNDLKNNNILIIGGNSGIGLALSQQLNRAGANIFTASRNPVEAVEGLSANHLRSTCYLMIIRPCKNSCQKPSMAWYTAPAVSL